MTRGEKAVAYFKEGYNCAQSVLLAFADLLPLEEENLALLSSSFGGGMGRMREVCGAVSGMFMVAGFLKGYQSPKATTEKAELYTLIQKLAEEFKKQNGSIICKELLRLNQKENSSVPEKRTEEYYKKRPCSELCQIAADIVAKELNID